MLTVWQCHGRVQERLPLIHTGGETCASHEIQGKLLMQPVPTTQSWMVFYMSIALRAAAGSAGDRKCAGSKHSNTNKVAATPLERRAMA